MSSDWRKPLFYVAALYDGIIGLVFLFRWQWFYARFGIAPPNHPGYVQFPALLLVIFAFLFLRIARDPQGNRPLIAYGIGLKVAYTSVVFFHDLTSGLAPIWTWFAWADLAFLVLFVMAMRVRMAVSPA